MKRITFLCLAAGLIACAGCGPQKPLTESEFKGFCYNYNGIYQPDCNTIAVCDEYLPVLELPQGTREKCMAQCQEVYEPQAMNNVLNQCSGAAQYARDWCDKYCLRAYPK